MVAVLRNGNYFLRFRFRLLTSYGSGSSSGSDFCQDTVTVAVPALYLEHKKHSKKLTCKETLRHVFIRVYRPEIQLVFSTQLCELLPL
jgi:hypothetical protein